MFVSVTQCQSFIAKFGIPWERTIVLRNAVDPIVANVDTKEPYKEGDPINFIYHTTPHRGLALLVPVIARLAEKHPEIHLDVYSSFKLYGWDDRDKAFEPLYDQIREHDNMEYHGMVDNATVREALTKADIFAYPCTWTETSCISLLEAMSAGLICVHPDNGALFETASNWTFMYHFMQDNNAHASHHYQMLNNMIDMIKENNEAISMKRRGMKTFTDIQYNWEVRTHEWKGFLKSIEKLPTEIEEESEEMFSYKVG